MENNLKFDLKKKNIFVFIKAMSWDKILSHSHLINNTKKTIAITTMS
jgi:hypothetical protein